MPDGTRKRRFSDNSAKRSWYAQWRSVRFTRRFGLVLSDRADLISLAYRGLALRAA